MKNYVLIAVSMAGLFLTAPAQAGDAAAGVKVFKKCKACPTFTPEAVISVGV